MHLRNAVTVETVKKAEREFARKCAIFNMKSIIILSVFA